MGLLLVDDLASIDPVLQHQIERAAREWLGGAQTTRCARPQPALDAAGVPGGRCARAVGLALIDDCLSG
jgi:hypothetical protein